MESLIQELLPYAKGFAGIYLIGNAISMIIVIIVAIFIIKRIIKSQREFEEEFKNIWK